MTIDIRNATTADVSTISDFNSRLAEETEARSLDHELVGSGVESIITDFSKGRYWVAVAGEKIIGQIAVTYEWSDWRNGMMWWISSVYVDSDHRRRGVYSSLYRHVESQAKSDPEVIGIRLYVEKENKKAQETYKKLGMDMTKYRIMESLITRDE